MFSIKNISAIAQAGTDFTLSKYTSLSVAGWKG
jgi:hypothetical protein